MTEPEILAWLSSFVDGVRRSRLKTLSALVAALLDVGAVGVTLLGRAVRGPRKVRHGIKRVDRFLGNAGVEIADCQAAIARMLRERCRRPWWVAIDWTSLGKGEFEMLTASAIIRGRALPLVWMTFPFDELEDCKTKIVKALLDRLRELVPPEQKVVILADREFGNAVLVRHLRSLGFQFVLRCRGNICVESEEFTGQLDETPMRLIRDKVLVMNQARFTRSRPAVHVTAVATWQRGQKDAWYLVAEIDGSPRAAIRIYGRRFRIEEMHRDGKERRFGMKLDAVRLRDAARYDRLMLVLVVAYAIWIAVGEWAIRTERHRGAQTNSTARLTLSVFRLGQLFIDEFRRSHTNPLSHVLRLVAESLEGACTPDPNWG